MTSADFLHADFVQGLDFPYLLQAGEPRGEPPPLVVLLHGYGSSAEGMMGLAAYLDAGTTVVAPQARRRLFNGGYGWYPLGMGPVAPVADVGEMEESRADLLRFARDAAAAHGADPARIFLVGFSQGAAMALCCALTEPEAVAGVVAMSGRIVPEILPRLAEPARTRGLPVLVTHGRDDEIVPVEQGRTAHRMLRERGMRAEYLEYPVGHALCRENVDAAAEWLRAQARRGTRAPRPT